MIITFERKVPQRSDASQNDHKRKGFPSKTSAASAKVKIDFQKTYFPALFRNVRICHLVKPRKGEDP